MFIDGAFVEGKPMGYTAARCSILSCPRHESWTSMGRDDGNPCAKHRTACGAATESGFNIIYGVVIPCAAGVVMIIISVIILSLGTTKKKENE